MNELIDKIKSKLVSAVDLDQKKIVRINDVYEALKTLEGFPMTLDILNASRIGKIVNDIRHFNEAASDVKSRLKDLIRRWNDKLLPHHNKKPEKLSKSSTNGCNKHIKVSESVNSLQSVNRNAYVEVSKNYRSSNNLEIMNGNANNHSTKYRQDCDQSFEIPNKIRKIDNETPRLKVPHSDSTKLQQKENHFDNKNIPNTIAQTNSLSSVDKSRKRKHESSTNGVTMTPIQKVKSTRELLAEMGDLVGNDTKKKILCNEIILEDDTPRSCLPESVRPRTKLLKSSKTAQSMEPSHKTIKTSPKVPEKISEYVSPIIATEDRPHIELKPQKHYKPYKESPTIDKNQKQTPSVYDDGEKVSLKLKIAVKHKKKSKHNEPPITNRMDDIPTLPDLDDGTPQFDGYMTNHDRGKVALSEAVVEKLAHSCWEGYNCTRHPTSGASVPVMDMYVVKGLYILPWTDTVYRSQGFFPSDTADELARLSDFVTGHCC